MVRDLDVASELHTDAMTTESRRHHTIKHIHSLIDRHQEFFGTTYAHEVARFVVGEMCIQSDEYISHLFLGLSYGQSTDRNPVDDIL